jgi:hypothetical protein
MKISKEQTQAFNELRIRKGLVPFCKQDMMAMIKPIIPVNDNYWKFLIDLGILEHKREGKKHYYMFTSFPIHVEKLHEYGKCCHEYNKRNKKEFTNCIQDAIDLLKENGYKIYKETITYEEI